jgi:hypothetical protein
MVPMIYHSSARSRAPSVAIVALSLYELFNKRDGTLRFATRRDLLEHFKLGAETAVILSGTDRDPSLERWWRLAQRKSVAHALAELGIVLVTAPNYSLFDDVPRLDNLYNMMRIAVSWSEIQREGLTCALHLNARTDRDWERWADFLNSHPEINHVAFEFGTGAGSQLRMPWHVGQLCNLARHVTRPLHLVVRGGINELTTLRTAFGGVTFIDTAAFVKAQKRQRAVISDGLLGWEKFPTTPGDPIDDLLDTNISLVGQYVSRLIEDRNSSPIFSET